MKTLEEIQNYQTDIRTAIDQQNFADISAIVEKYKVQTEQENIKEFYEGETCFYDGQYEQALKHYLKARELPLSHFYCYRASAYVSKTMGQIEKAINFAKKAEVINPDDYFVKNLFEGLKELPSDLEQTQLSTISNPMEHLSDIGEKQMDELLTLSNASKNDLENEGQGAYGVGQKQYVDLGFDIDILLKEKMNDFEQNKIDMIQDYLLKCQDRTTESQILKFFTDTTAPSHLQFESILSSEPHEDNVTSVYIRWNNQGLLINPSSNFLKIFHQQGHFLNEINYVIVTTDSSNIHSEVKKIHRFNTLLNTYNSEIHVIHYYLNHVSYQQLARFLKPNYKQEKNTVHLLELFRDSPEVEKQQLSDAICLHYFPIANKESFASYQERDLLSPSLGLRVELKDENSHHSTLIGFLSNCIWSPLLAHHVGLCDILITSFGFTNAEDLEKRKYNDSCLGYYGTASLLEEIQPKFLCCMEFSTRHGDIRLELMQKLRKDFEQFQTIVCHPAILPADDNLQIHLEDLLLKCSLTHQWVEPEQIKIIKTDLNFGSLGFLHPACCL